MPESNFTLYIALEIAFLLLLVCVFLLFHVRSLSKLIKKLETKVGTLRDDVRKAKAETSEALARAAASDTLKPRDFLSYLDEEIEGTRAHHQSLDPDRDIVLDIAPDAPIERQAASLRHAVLLAEKEARFAGGDDSSNWDVLQSKFQQIIQFFKELSEVANPGDAAEEAGESEATETEDNSLLVEELANSKKRIENLERFKKLFLDMESKWQATRKQADEYASQLAAMGRELGADENFEALMENYTRAYEGVGSMIENLAGGEDNRAPSSASKDKNEDTRERGGVGKMVIQNQEEMQRLRNMAVDQHKVIVELKKKLALAESLEEKDDVIEQLSTQLDRQERFLKEAETCTQLLEDELSRAMQENQRLTETLENSGGGDPEEMKRLETLVEDMTSESREMLQTIGALEQENRDLMEKLKSSATTNGSSKNEELLKQKLVEIQQEMLNLQTQHIELEERYLELKLNNA